MLKKQSTLFIIVFIAYIPVLSTPYERPFFYRDGSYKEPLYYDFYDYGRPYYQYNVTSGIMFGYN